MLEMEGVNQSPMLFGALMAEAKKRRISALKTPEKKQELWNDYLRVILVRNPFERFVSGYTDKLVPEGRGYSYIYKPISIKLQSQFKSMRNNPSDRVLSQEHATFEDFVNYLIRTPDGGRDNHWKSYEWWCGPCEHGYDIIMKMETLRDDVKYLWELLGISEEHRKWFFPEVKPAVDRLETERYFEKIPKNLSEALYDISKRDFNMFGYPKPKNGFAEVKFNVLR
uniref:Carbohydrate sulfotransferase n=1 Tax=Ciona savignyi TaxID=51511 RepID=H2YMM8_CIOSA